LVEGIVKIENNHQIKQEFSYTLKPKEKIAFYKSELAKNVKTEKPKPSEQAKVIEHEGNAVVVYQSINTELTTSWKDRRWIIDGEELSSLAVLLERRYDVKITLLSDDLKKYKFSGTIENETFEQVLHLLSLVLPVKYELQKGYVTMDIDKTLKDKYSSFLKNTFTK
jgi:transmembrane sensor